MEPNTKLSTEQGAIEVIKHVNKITAHTWLVTKMGNSIWYILQVLCYLISIGLILFAISLPSGGFTESTTITEHVTVEANVKVDELLALFTVLKLLLVFLGVLMLVPAALFKKIRKKNNVLEEVNNVTSKFIENQQPN